MAQGKPIIYWNGNTTQMPKYLERGSIWEAPAIDEVVVNRSQSGKQESTVVGHYKQGKLIFSRISSADYKSLMSMFSYIQKGYSFGFLFDGSLTPFATTVFSQISSTIIEVNDSTNILAGQSVYMRTSDWLEEYNTVSSITGAAFAWTSRTSGTVQNINSIAYGAGIYVAVGANGTILTSSDGITWAPQTGSLPGETLQFVIYGNGLFVVGSYTSGYIMTSPDGITWTTRFSTPFGAALCGVWSGTKFTVGVSGGHVVASPDGITWTDADTLVTANSIYGITYGAGLFVGCTALAGTGGKVITSPDGVTWTLRTIPTTTDLHGIVWSGSLFVVVGNTGTIHSSPDGITWTNRTAPSANDLAGICWTGRQFIATSSSGTYATSTDGITWTQTTLSGVHNAILSANNLLLIVGNTGEIYTSTRPHQVTFTAALKNTYLSGDICRLEGYYPAVIIPNRYKLQVPTPNPGMATQNITIDFEEQI